MKKLLLPALSLFLSLTGFVSHAQTYCAPIYTTGCVEGDQIDGFTTTGGVQNINNLTSTCPSGAYTHYSGMAVSGYPGDIIGFTVQAGIAYDQGFRIWIDWNGDGDFSDPGEDVWNSVTSVSSITSSFTIPNPMPPGTIRLRVRSNYSAIPTDPCASQTYGEAEDYDITILPTGPCTNPPYVGMAESTDSVVCAGVPFNLSLDSVTFGSGQSFQWQISSDSLSWTNMLNDTLPVVNGVTQSSTNYYRCIVTCGVSDTSGVVKVETTSIPLPAGNYTINSASPTGGSNYQSFMDFFTAIECGGIGGNIILDVAPSSGPYNEQIMIGLIGGVSSTNQITINGNGNVVFDTLNVSTERGVLMIEDGQHINFNDLTFEASTAGTYGFAAQLLGLGTSYISFNNCTFKSHTTSTSTFFAGLVVGGSPTGATTASASPHHITIDSCVVEGGYYGLVMNGPTTGATSLNNVVTNTEVRDFYLYGSYLRGQNNLLFENNDIHRANRATVSTFYGVYMAGENPGTRISKNIIHDAATQNKSATAGLYPFYLTTASGTSTDPLLITNNRVYNINSSGTKYGYYVLGTSDYVHIYHNTMHLGNPASTGSGTIRGLYVTAALTGLEYKNNILVVEDGGSGTQHVVYIASTATSADLNNNAYGLLSPSGVDFGYWGGDQATIADWRTASGFDTASFAGDPILIDPAAGDVTPGGSVADAIGMDLTAIVPDDVNGVVRTTTPDAGAIEYTPLPCLPPLIDSLMVSVSTPLQSEIWFNVGTDVDSVRVEWGPMGFTPATGSATYVTGSSVVIDNYQGIPLGSNTCYDVYFVSYCGGTPGLLSTGPVTFCTPCSPAMMPYIENFTTWPPNCVSVDGGSAPWMHYTGAGEWAEANFWSLNNVDYYLDMRHVDVTTDALVSFTWSHLYSTTYPLDGMKFMVRVYGTSTWDVLWEKEGSDFNSLDGATNTVPGTGVREMFLLDTSYTGNIVEFRFDAHSGFGPDAFVDSFVVEPLPACLSPMNLALKSITDSSATLTWGAAPGRTATAQWGPVGFVPGTGVSAWGLTSPGTITGLNPSTEYDVYLMDSCNGTWVGPITIKTLCASQLSGTYTVGGPIGPNNFTTLDSAVAALECGVDGPVIFNITGNHSATGSVVLGPIIGASAVNTVTFDGGSPATTTITKTAGTEAVFDFVGARHVTLKNMTIEDNATASSYGVRFMGDSDSNTVENNVISLNPTTSTFSTAGVVVTNSTTSPTTAGANVDYLQIRNNVINGAYYGISAYGVSSTSKRHNITVEGNTFTNQYYYGMSIYYYDTVTIVDNVVNKPRNTFSYGIYHYYNDNSTITGNYVKAITYCMYSPAVNNVDANGQTLIANNMFVNDGSTTNSAVYFTTSSRNYEFYHNTIYSNGYALQDFASSNYDVRNNIFVSGNLTINYSVSPGTSDVMDYNIYHRTTSGTLAEFSAAYADLAALQAGQPGHNANSLQGDPVFVDPLNDLHLLGSLANDSGVVLASVTVDIDGDPRSATTPDIGADEYTPVSGDLDLLSGDFIKGLCLSTNDTIVFEIHNLIGPAVSFSTDPLTISYAVSGPVNTTGTIVVNTGTLNPQDTLSVFEGGIDLSVPGTYILTAYMDSNAVNSLALNDTLDPAVDIDVKEEFSVSPQTVTLASAQDSVELCVESSFFSGGSDFFISEVCHYKYTVGAPAGGWPSYLVADDYIEITGAAGSDLGGITLEQWDGSSMMSSHTFPPNTLLSPNGTAIIAIGQMGASTPSPADFYYHGNGSYTGSFGSGGNNGRILKDASGAIIDAVGVGTTYSFPAASGVTAADWSGNSGNHTTTSGVRLTGPDLNNASNWVVSNVEPQDPNVVNNNVPVPSPQAQAGLTWTLNGVQVDTAACFYTGPFTSPGSYTYIASYTNTCGTFTDSAVVIVPSCTAPSGVSGTALSSSSVEVTWDSTGTGATNFDVEYGPVGFTPGNGTRVSSTGTSSTVTGLSANICQDYYVRSACGATDTSAWVGPVELCPKVSLCDSMEQYSTGPIVPQSSLFYGWYGTTTGAAVVSTTQASSGTQSIYIPGDGVSDIVAWFDTINQGTWNFSFDIFVPTGTEAYYNFQRNYTHGVGGTNAWAFDVNLLSNGTGSIDGGSYGGTGIATFSYNSGQWNTIEHIIDFDNDSVTILVNGTPASTGWIYSFGNMTVPVQCNGINFYSNPGLTNPDYYIDDLCITPYGASCPAPTSLTTNNVGCTTAVVSWNSSVVAQSSIVEYGLAGFIPGTGTVLTNQNSPLTITGLTPGTNYEFYVTSVCGSSDTSLASGPSNFTTASGPLPTLNISDSQTLVNDTMAIYVLDANSSGADSIHWDFGGGNIVSGEIVTDTFTVNGTIAVTVTAYNACGSRTYNYNLVIEGISLDENALDHTLSVYPNPSTGIFNLEFALPGDEEVYLQVINTLGQVVSDEYLGDINSFSGTVDLSNLPKGVYILKLQAGDAVVNRRLSLH